MFQREGQRGKEGTDTSGSHYHVDENGSYSYRNGQLLEVEVESGWS